MIQIPFLLEKINATAFNHQYGDLLVVPEGKYDERVMIVPGTDGRKMSKSYNNFINIFLDEKPLKKQVMSIITDSLALDDPKDPDTCNVFGLYKLVAEANEVSEMRKKYQVGGFGYGHAKKALLEVLIDSYKTPRDEFNRWMNDKGALDEQLALGAEKARTVGTAALGRVRNALGY